MTCDARSSRSRALRVSRPIRHRTGTLRGEGLRRCNVAASAGSPVAQKFIRAIPATSPMPRLPSEWPLAVHPMPRPPTANRCQSLPTRANPSAPFAAPVQRGTARRSYNYTALHCLRQGPPWVQVPPIQNLLYPLPELLLIGCSRGLSSADLSPEIEDKTGTTLAIRSPNSPLQEQA